MKKTDYLIIGGSAAGTTAAEVIRGLKPEATITIINEEDHEQYSRVLLPHYIRHKITREQVFLKKPQWYTHKNIELAGGVKAESLDAQSHKVGVSGGEQYQYKKLLLAIGGEVVKLNIPGHDLANILYLRTIEDGDRLIKASKGGKKAIVIGGGFVSLDFATGFHMNGVADVTILARDGYFWSKHLDAQSSQIMQKILEKNGVRVITNAEADHFEGDGRVSAVVTKSGERLEADVVGVGIGIKPDLDWLASAGIAVNRAILTNEYLETNLPDIYAAGDCSEFHDVFFQREHVMGNWANATSQGLAAAKTMCGVRTVYETISSYSDTFFEGTYSFIGVTDEKYADKVVSRGSVELGKMARIFIKEFAGTNSDSSDRVRPCTRIVGASIINDPSEVSPLTAAIKGKKDVSAFIDKLSDPNFDLKELLV